MTLIASLAMADAGEPSLNTVSPGPDIANRRPIGRTSRISADGRYVTFMSSRSLTGYDNTNAASVPSTSTNGAADYEVFRYDADTEKLTCVSCNPSGARPHGRALAKWYNVDRDATNFTRETTPIEYWAAGWLPTWETSLHASRALSEDGSRVFFNSYDPLVPEDTNGKQDVYQWEAPGSGTCTVGGRGYSKQNEGCVSLISTGQSSEYSEFMDASASGDRVFLRTDESIYPEDPFGLDIYAATVGGGFPPPPGPPTACEGDACQNIPSPPHAPSPASAAFRGAGNPAPQRSCGGPARRAAKLSRRARRLRHAARHSRSASRSKLLLRRAARNAKQAKRLSGNAKRCRRAVRRAGR